MCDETRRDVNASLNFNEDSDGFVSPVDLFTSGTRTTCFYRATLPKVNNRVLDQLQIFLREVSHVTITNSHI